MTLSSFFHTARMSCAGLTMLGGALGTEVWAQSCGDEYRCGYVRTADGMPIANTSVSVFEGTDDRVRAPRTARTSDQGLFRFAANATVRLRVSRIGFAPTDTLVAAAPATSLPLVIVLSPIATTLAQVVITPGVRSLADASVSNTVSLSRLDLERRPQPLDDLFRSLSRFPGSTQSDESARPLLRGAAADETPVYFDHFALKNAYHLKDFDGAISVIDASLVEGITVTPSGAPVDFGDRIGGLITMAPRSVTSAKPLTSVSLGLTGVRLASEGRWGEGAGDWLVSARRGWLDAALRAAGASDVINPVYGDAYTRVTRWIGVERRITWHAIHWSDRMSFRDTGDPTLGSRYRTSSSWLTYEQAGAPWRLAATTGLTWDVRRRDADLAGTRPKFLIDGQSSRAWLSRAMVDRDLGSRVTWRSGVETRIESSTSEFLVASGSTPPAETVRESGVRAGLWSAVRIQLVPSLVAEGGARADHWTLLSKSALAPRASLLWQPATHTTVRLSLGSDAQGYSPTDPRTTAEVAQARYFTRSNGVSASISSRIAGSLRLQLDAYDRRETGDRMRWLNVSGGLSPVPELESDRQAVALIGGRVSGVELLSSGVIGKSVTWSAGWSTARARDRTRDFADRPRPWEIRQTGTADISLVLGRGWSVATGALWHSGWPVAQARVSGSPPAIEWPYPLDTRTPSYQRIDLRVARNWRYRRQAWRVWVDVFNTFNEFNVRGLRASLDGRPPRLFTTYEGLIPRLPSAGLAVTF